MGYGYIEHKNNSILNSSFLHFEIEIPHITVTMMLYIGMNNDQHTGSSYLYIIQTLEKPEKRESRMDNTETQAKQFEHTKKVIRRRKSKKDRQYNWKKANEKEQEDKQCLQNTTQKTNDRATRNPLKPWVNLCVPEV